MRRRFWALWRFFNSSLRVGKPSVTVLFRADGRNIRRYEVPMSVAYDGVDSEGLFLRFHAPTTPLADADVSRVLGAATSSGEFKTGLTSNLFFAQTDSAAVVCRPPRSVMAEWLRPRYPGLLMDVAIEELRQDVLLSRGPWVSPVHFVSALHAVLPRRHSKPRPIASLTPDWEIRALREYLAVIGSADAFAPTGPDFAGGVDFFEHTGTFVVDAGCGSLARAQAYRNAGFTVSEATKFEALQAGERPDIDTLRTLAVLG